MRAAKAGGHTLSWKMASHEDRLNHPPRNAIATSLRRSGDRPEALDTATARSALMLVARPEPERLKICPNCHWLFLDRSRNHSRAWCDMAVCGNRVKARRHYHRQKGEDA